MAETRDSVRVDNASEAADNLNSVLTDLLDRCFPWKEFVIKSTDPPWMNNDIRRCSKSKRRAFRQEGRGPNYRRLEKEMNKLVKEAKSRFFEGVKAEVVEKGNNRGYYRAVKRFSTKDCPTPWNISSVKKELKKWHLTL